MGRPSRRCSGPVTGISIEITGNGHDVIASFGAGASTDVPLGRSAVVSYASQSARRVHPPHRHRYRTPAPGTADRYWHDGYRHRHGNNGTGTGSSSPGQGSTGTITHSRPPSGSPITDFNTAGHQSTQEEGSKKVVPPKKRWQLSRRRSPIRRRWCTRSPRRVVQHPAAKPKVHVVSHPAKKVIKVSTSHSALAKKPTHVVDHGPGRCSR